MSILISNNPMDRYKFGTLVMLFSIIYISNSHIFEHISIINMVVTSIYAN